MHNRIVVVGVPRSGTTFFTNQFRTDQRKYTGEINNPHSRFYFSKGNLTAAKLPEYDDTAYLENFEILKLYNKPYVTKVILQQYTRDIADDIMKQIDLLNSDLLIYCKRDLIDTLISLNNSSATNIWNINEYSLKSTIIPKVDVDWILPDYVITTYYDIKRKWDRWARTNKNVVIKPYTNDMIDVHKQWLLDYKVDMTRPSTVKVSSIEDYQNNISIKYNIEEVRAHIKRVIGDYR